jgi:methyltransferase (TIGR00027 family)
MSTVVESTTEAISWEEDYRRRTNPDLFTDLLQESVPLLKHLGWRVVETAEGYARTHLPLNCEATNQHGTHQAAAIMIAGDYTGGVALATLFRGFPIVGVHPRAAGGEADTATMWLAKAEITYHAPSTDDLAATCTIPSDRIGHIRQRFLRGRSVLLPLEVQFESGGVRVATATLTYFARRSSFLKPRTPDARPTVLHTHLVKSSARLIAGIRALESASEGGNADPFSSRVAGVHGRLLASRFTAILPQLRDMVAARTRDADQALREALWDGAQQVVFVGVGLDCRAFRMLAEHPEVTVFELDLPTMLTVREEALAAVADLPGVRRRAVPIDLERQDVAEALLATGEFDLTLVTFVIFEGGTMYFDAETNRRIFASLWRLLDNPDSTLWTDFVSRPVVDGTTGYAEVEGFLREMGRLGEPFVFGLDNPSPYFAELGYEAVRSRGSDWYLREHDDPLFAHYHFHVLRRALPCWLCGDAITRCCIAL